VPSLLAIDTATDVCSTAFWRNGQVLARAVPPGPGHSALLLTEIDALLREAGCALRDCDAIAFGAGPGAFTGLRVACGVAQGLAWGLGCPVVPVGNLLAMATAAHLASRPADARRIGAVLDARMDEVYCACYAFTATAEGEQAPATAVELAAPTLVSRAALPSWCAQAGAELLAVDERLPPLPGGRMREWRGAVSAASIAIIGSVALAAGRTVAAAEAAPLYVRDRVALSLEERRLAAASLP